MADAEADGIVAGVTRRLREVREAQGMSMNQLGSLAGLDQVTISRIEKGERSPTLRSLVKIAEALGVSLCCILAEAEKPDDHKGG